MCASASLDKLCICSTSSSDATKAIATKRNPQQKRHESSGGLKILLAGKLSEFKENSKQNLILSIIFC